jgi:dTDP-4-dehydrorhamnose reductase
LLSEGKEVKKLIFGNGKVANVIKDKKSVILTKEQCDVSDYDAVRRAFEIHTPDVAINCAAITNLEKCEELKKRSYAVNTLGPLNLLEASIEKNVKLVHISSGCLFDGNDRISTEDSIPEPAVWYTRTKTWADEYIINRGYNNFLILRPRQLIASFKHPGNVLTKFAKLDSIGAIQEPNSVTGIEDFSEMIEHLIDIDATGVFNCCNEGTITPYDIAMAVKEGINPELQVRAISYSELLSLLPNRRVNTILSMEKIKSTGYTPRTAKEALQWCVKNYNG